MGDRTEVPGWCALCRSRCATINVVEDGRLLEVRPDPDQPTGGALCPKGRAAPEIVHSARRILTPLRRTRPKGDPDPGWVPIGWDEALDEVAARLDAVRREIGPEGVAFAVTTPSGTAMSDSIDWVERFIRLFGSPNNIYATELCNWHKDHAHAFTFGCGIPVAQYRDAGLMMLWGHNPSKVWLAQASAIAEGRRRGAKLLVVDPRRSAHAAEADLWLAVRPGTDAALALGLAHLLLESGRYDDGFVRAWTNAPLLVREDTGDFLHACDLAGAENASDDAFVAWDGRAGAPLRTDTRARLPEADLARLALDPGVVSVRTRAGPAICRTAFAHYRAACAPYGPDRVAQITGVPVGDVRRAADLLAEAGERIAYHGWTGIGQHANATQTDRAIATLYGLTGAFDTPRGNLVTLKLPVNPLTSLAQLPPAQLDKALGRERLPVGPPSMGWVIGSDVYTAILEEKPYPVRALVGFGANLLLSQPDSVRAAAALTRLPFHVHCDIFHTPTSAFADIVLPVGTPWEREALKVGFEITQAAEEVVRLRPAAVAPVGESRSDAAIVAALATRLGMGEHFFGGSLEAGWNHVLAPLGLDVEALRARPGGVRVPLAARARKYAEAMDGKGSEGSAPVRGFATPTRRAELYSGRLARHGQSPVPVHVEPPERMAAGGRAPLTLLSAKNGYFCHSQHRGIRSLRRRSPDPVIEIHPVLAAEKGLEDGDWARVKTRVGTGRFKVRTEPSLRPDVVVAPYGWWEACPDLGLPGFDPLGPDTANLNALIGAEPGARDPVSGAAALRSFACDIEPERADARRSWHGFRPFRVEAVTPEARDVVSIDLAPIDGEPLPDYRPGQSLPVRVRPGGLPAEAPAPVRNYSLVGAAVGPGRTRYRIAVKRIGADPESAIAKDGLVSTYLARDLRVGDLVEAGMPGGHFTLPVASDFPVVLCAAGVGITPFMAYLETLAIQETRRPETLLLFGCRDGRGHPFRARLAALAAAIPELTIVNVYSRPGPEDRPGRDYDVLGRVSADLVPARFVARRARVYMCGPGAMMRELSAGLRARGAFPFEIFQEAFHVPALPDGAGEGRPRRIRFARSGRDAVWTRADGTVLDLGERLGLSLPAGCRVGQCESCTLPILSGDVRHLGGEDVEPGQCLTCRAVPASDLVLDA